MSAQSRAAAGLLLGLIAFAASGDDTAAPVRGRYVLPVTVNTLFNERDDAPVRVTIDFAALLEQAAADAAVDDRSICVVRSGATGEAVVPSRFVSTGGGRGDVCWTLSGHVGVLQTRRFLICFDTLDVATAPASAAAPAVAGSGAAANLIVNPGFEDAAGGDPRVPAGWRLGKDGASAALCRTSSDARSGRYCLKLVTTPDRLTRQVAQLAPVPVRAGKRYLLRCWIKSPDFERGAAGAWAWYLFGTGRPAYSNYKTTAGGKPGTEWTQYSASWINIHVKADSEQRRLPGLLPDTRHARIEVGAYYGAMTLYIDDVSFIELADRQAEPVEVTLGTLEVRGLR
jgi:hypothetical protein